MLICGGLQKQNYKTSINKPKLTICESKVVQLSNDYILTIK